ncbi:MAG: tetratricopeptide repeat protein, partial [Cyanobacteriota bacterium]
ANYGTRHPNVALCLNNLALLLKKTNRLEEAEPLMRQNVEILVACSSQGFRNPNLEIGITNYISLLQSMGLPQPKIKARLQSLQPASPSP